jgi:hypothetical protein
MQFAVVFALASMFVLSLLAILMVQIHLINYECGSCFAFVQVHVLEGTENPYNIVGQTYIIKILNRHLR